MKILRSALFLATALFLAIPSMAAVDVNKTPTRMGIRPDSSSAYFFVAEGLSLNCTANVILITLDASGFGRTAFASILAAKITGRRIAYLEYTQDMNGYCTLVQVDID